MDCICLETVLLCTAACSEPWAVAMNGDGGRWLDGTARPPAPQRGHPEPRSPAQHRAAAPALRVGLRSPRRGGERPGEQRAQAGGKAAAAPGPRPCTEQREPGHELAAPSLAERVTARINMQSARGRGYYSEIMQLSRLLTS